jgi:hypothetical protein
MAFGQVGQGSKASGTAAKLAAAWAQWAYSKPVGASLLIGGDPTYTEAQCDGQPVTATQGKKWFLAGTFDQRPVVRTCTMPVGTQLFFPVVSSLAFPFLPGETEENQHEAAIAFIEAVLDDPDFSMRVTVDGKEVKSNRIVRATLTGFTLSLPEGEFFRYVPSGAGG